MQNRTKTSGNPVDIDGKVRIVGLVGALVADGYKLYAACEKIGVSKITYYRYRKAIGLDPQKGDGADRDRAPNFSPAGGDRTNGSTPASPDCTPATTAADVQSQGDNT